MQQPEPRHPAQEPIAREMREIADKRDEGLVHLALPERKTEVMVIDDEQPVVGAENGRNGAIFEKAPELAPALRAPLDLLALGCDGAHADGHLCWPEIAQWRGERLGGTRLLQRFRAPSAAFAEDGWNVENGLRR